MIAPFEVVKGMPLQPNCCTLCGNNPANEDGTQMDAIFVPGVDVDWGNSVYICMACANVIASLIGRVTVEGFDKLIGKYEALKDEYDQVVEEHTRDAALLGRIRDGATAQKEVKAQKKVTA